MMKGGRRFGILSVLTFLAFFGACGRSQQSLKVRGLYLGMPMAEAVQRVEEMYRQVEGGRFRPVQWRQWDSSSAHTDRETASDITIGNGDRGIRYICFNPGLVDKLFGSASLSAEQLAQRFAQEHGLPALKHGINRNPPQPTHYWEFVSRRGWKVFIDQDKTLVLQDWRQQENEKY